MSTSSPRKILLINNSIFSLLSWILPVVIGFVATPLIVRNLGNREYGLYATILGFISYSFSFGIGKILTKYVAEYRASGESDKIGEVVSATFWLSFTLALGGSLIVAGRPGTSLPKCCFYRLISSVSVRWDYTWRVRR